jgi:hypothetical protein
MKNTQIEKRETRNEKRLSAFVLLLTSFVFLLSSHVFGQFTSSKDTLVILSGDSTTYYYTSYRAAADTSGGQPYVGKTAGFDLKGKTLAGVDFDTTAAWTTAKFAIQTSATYNRSADTTGGSPYDWKTVNYHDTVYTFTPETKAINILNSQVVYALKRYIRFICLEAAGTWTANEAARRKLVLMIR